MLSLHLEGRTLSFWSLWNWQEIKLINLHMLSKSLCYLLMKYIGWVVANWMRGERSQVAMTVDNHISLPGWQTLYRLLMKVTLPQCWGLKHQWIVPYSQTRMILLLLNSSYSFCSLSYTRRSMSRNTKLPHLHAFLFSVDCEEQKLYDDEQSVSAEVRHWKTVIESRTTDEHCTTLTTNCRLMAC